MPLELTEANALVPIMAAAPAEQADPTLWAIVDDGGSDEVRVGNG